MNDNYENGILGEIARLGVGGVYTVGRPASVAVPLNVTNIRLTIEDEGHETYAIPNDPPLPLPKRRRRVYLLEI